MVPIACHLGCYRQVLGREGLVRRLDTVLAQVAAAGFPAVHHLLDCVQTDADAARYAELLAKHGLTSAGIYTSAPLHEPRSAQAFESALLKALSAIRGHLSLQTLTLNPDPLPDGLPKTDPQLDAQAESLLQISGRLSEMGVRLVYHFRGPELANEAREFKRMMRLVPSRYIGLCFDADWAARSGHVPDDLLDAFAPRVVEMQLRSSRGGVWDEVLDDGDVRLRDLVELLDDHDFKGWYIVALNREPKTPKTLSLPEALRRSYTYARALLASTGTAARFRYFHP